MHKVNGACHCGNIQLDMEQSVSPQKLSDSAKMGRWQDIWFSDVAVAPAP